MRFPGGSDCKESACSMGDPGSIPGLRRSPGEGNGYQLQVFLSGESHGQRSLVSYSPWSCTELDMTEWLTHIHTCYSSNSSSMVTKAVKSKKSNTQLKIQNVKCEKTMGFCFLIIWASVLCPVFINKWCNTGLQNHCIYG